MEKAAEMHLAVKNPIVRVRFICCYEVISVRTQGGGGGGGGGGGERPSIISESL
jgi:hypothetical protein